MTFDPVEGVDYIFDRYAFLQKLVYESAVRAVFKDDLTIAEQALAFADLPPDQFAAKFVETFPGKSLSVGDIPVIDENTPREKIEKAVRDGRSAYHPDRFNKVGIRAMKQAEYQRNLIDECAKILLNDQLRPLYNERLASFKKDQPRFVSESGAPIVDLSAEKLSLDDLLADDIPDTTEFEERVRQMVQFDERKFGETADLFKSLGDNPKVRKIYKDELTKKLVYLELLEDAAWAKVGYMKKKDKTDGSVYYADDYVNKVEAELKRVSEQVIENTVRERHEVLALGMGRPMLLLTDGSADSGAQPANDDDTLAKIKSKARENLEIRAEYVREVAKRKQAVLEELVTLADTLDLTPRDPASPEYNIYLANPDEQQTVIAKFNLNAGTTNVNLENVPRGQTLSALKESLSAAGSFNAVALVRNAELSDFMLEVTHTCGKIVEDWRSRNGPPSVPQP